MSTKLTYVNAESQQKDLTPWNHQNGCKVFENDTDQSLLFMQLRDDNTCVVDSVDEYSALYQINSTVGTNNLGKIESKLSVEKYVNAGSLTAFNYEDVDNEQLFAKIVSDTLYRPTLYSQVLIGDCANKTIKALKIEPITFNNDVITLNGETVTGGTLS